MVMSLKSRTLMTRYFRTDTSNTNYRKSTKLKSTYEIKDINRPFPNTLKQLRNKREIEELGVYTMPTSNKKRQINRPVELYPILDSRNQSNKRKSESIHIGRKK
jgi:hypothetical protein